MPPATEQIAGWQPSKYTDGPNESGYFTAGIDIPMEKYDKPDTHSHAIEFHAKDRTTAEARRDLVIAALCDSHKFMADLSHQPKEVSLAEVIARYPQVDPLYTDQGSRYGTRFRAAWKNLLRLLEW